MMDSAAVSQGERRVVLPFLLNGPIIMASPGPMIIRPRTASAVHQTS